MAYLYLVFFAILISSGSCLEQIPCPLEWAQAASDSKVPSKSVAAMTGENANFVIKQSDEDGLEKIGRVSLENGTLGIGYLPTVEGSESQEVDDFYVLTNPNGCRVTWVSSAEQDPRAQRFAVSVGNFRVGRAIIEDELLPVNILKDNTALYTDEDKITAATSSYFILISFSDGLSLTLTQFEVESSEGQPQETFEVDEMTNRADVDVMYTISHSKTITESVTITETHAVTSTWNLAASVQGNFQFDIKHVSGSIGGGGSVDISQSTTKGFGKSITNTNTRVISVSRSIFVPPKTSVVACARITSLENANFVYNAIAVYTAVGLNGTEVFNIVRQSFPNAVINGDTVVVPTRGEMAGNFALTTSLTVNPEHAVVPCDKGANFV